MPTRVSGYRDDELPVGIRCPDCGKVDVHADMFDGGNPISAECPECGVRLYFADDDDESDCPYCEGDGCHECDGTGRYA